MKKKVLISLALVATLILAATLVVLGVESKRNKQNDGLVKTYVYEKGGFGGEFTLRLNEDSTFTYYAGMLSSYIGFGNWSVQGDILTLTETNGWINRFRIDGGDLVFISEGSENFMYVKVGDGERFVAYPEAPAEMSDAE